MNHSFVVLGGGTWTAAEVMLSPLPKTRLAVLSACQTGLGGEVDGGIIGLTRAFELAGVPRVAMSLWSVDDAATAELMSNFARELAASPPAEALRRAMVSTRRNRPDPAQWASFALFGTPR